MIGDLLYLVANVVLLLAGLSLGPVPELRDELADMEASHRRAAAERWEALDRAS